MVPDTQLPDAQPSYLADAFDEKVLDRRRTQGQVFNNLTGSEPAAVQDSSPLWLGADREEQDDGRCVVPPTR